METRKFCPLCEGPMNYKEGVGKTTGKAYRGWFCAKGMKCKGKPIFLKDNEPNDIGEIGAPSVKGASYEPEGASSYEKRREEGMRYLNALNNAAVILAAAVGSGRLTEDEAIAKYEEVAQKIYNFGTGDES